MISRNSLSLGVTMPRVFVPPVAWSLTGGRREIGVNGVTVRDVINSMERDFPGIRDCLCDGDVLRSGLSVVIDHSISSLGLLQSVREDSEIHFLPTLGGG
jgi:sulfur-carrier protein